MVRSGSNESPGNLAPTECRACLVFLGARLTWDSLWPLSHHPLIGERRRDPIVLLKCMPMALPSRVGDGVGGRVCACVHVCVHVQGSGLCSEPELY